MLGKILRGFFFFLLVLSRTIHTQRSFLSQGSPLSSDMSVSLESSLSLLKIGSDRDDPYDRNDYMETLLVLLFNFNRKVRRTFTLRRVELF